MDMITRKTNRAWCCISAAITFAAPSVAGVKRAYGERPMSKDNESAEAQMNVTYAETYVIQTTTSALLADELGETAFVSRTGLTSWPCMARLFDDAQSAWSEIIALGLANARVVRIALQYAAEVVEMVEKVPSKIMMMQCRQVA